MAGRSVVVAGHVCLDLTPTFPGGLSGNIRDLLVPGALVAVGDCVVSTGGSAANTGGALARLGMDVKLMARLGDDTFGKAILERIGGFASTRWIRIARGEPTSYTIVLSPPGMDRVFLHNPGTNDTFSPSDINFRAVERSALFHFGYPPLMKKMYEDGGEALAGMFRRAKRCGVTTSLDMALPDPDSPGGKADWDGILRKTLPYVDLFLPSIEEVLYCLDRERFLKIRAEARSTGREPLELISTEDFSRLAARLIEYGAGVVMLKAGRKGLYVRTGTPDRLRKMPLRGRWECRELWMPPFVVERIASATGAGDCAIAGFLAAFVSGEALEGCIRFAAACGAENLSAYDATSGIKPYRQTARLIKGWKTSPAGPGGPWRFDETIGMWRGPSDAA